MDKAQKESVKVTGESAGAGKSRQPRQALSPLLLARIVYQPSLIYFNAVAKYLSVREAGRQLNVASSAITRQLAQLEDALGLELFHRDGRRLKLSADGEILSRHGNRLTAQLEAAVSELDMLRGLMVGEVKIGTVESVGLTTLREIIIDFRVRYPRLNIDVSVVPATEVISRLLDERIDIGFGFITLPIRGIDVVMRRDVRIGVVMRPDHALASKETLTLGECLRYSIVVAKPELSIREVIEPFLRRSGPDMPALIEVDSIRLLVDLAKRGNFVSVMTPIGVQDELATGSLVFRELRDSGLPTNRFALMVRGGGGLSFAGAAFLQTAKTHLDSIKFPGEV